MRPEILALVVPAALLIRYMTPAPPARAQRRGRGAALVGSRPRSQRSEPTGRPTSRLHPIPASIRSTSCSACSRGSAAAEANLERLSVAIPSHAITLQGSALFHTGDRQRVHAAVEGKLDDSLSGTVLLMTCERRDENDKRLALAVRPHRRRDGGRDARAGRDCCCGGAHPAAARALRQPDGYIPLSLESAELDELYDVRIAAGCDETAAREALTPAMIAWLCERAPEALVVETGGASVRLATAALLSSDEELDAFSADACWLAHAFIDAAPAQAQAA